MRCSCTLYVVGSQVAASTLLSNAQRIIPTCTSILCFMVYLISTILRDMYLSNTRRDMWRLSNEELRSGRKNHESRGERVRKKKRRKEKIPRRFSLASGELSRKRWSYDIPTRSLYPYQLQPITIETVTNYGMERTSSYRAY